MILKYISLSFIFIINHSKYCIAYLKKLEAV